ncbi:MAG: LLM class flavin-dependent oxidoreductase [Nitrososphaerota archaeon]|jgi:alkanesulfonate monooxygenase SsuD/methylene tetrahydromethanopterin reductase-like flavin-dependent oxidoreductase (luciferase family)|nr:LLM class flavin-dependent oxidoreductase [Nitrososphaerota archaeon]
MTKFKYGVFLPFYAFSASTTNHYYSELKNIVLECERLGYDSIWLDDHLMYGNAPILECMTTLSALAAITHKIRLGILVTCNAHRNPALIAKTAATIDIISKGRLEFGMGAGTQASEHRAYGFSFPLPSVRIAQLEEAIEVTQRLWTQPKANYYGKYYTLKDAMCEPKPQQKPHPPITVGGGGEKHTLRVAAKYADRIDWGFLPSIEMYRKKLSILKQNCELIGRDFHQIELSCWPSGQILLAGDQTTLQEKIAKYKPVNISLDAFKQYTLIGTAKDCQPIFQPYIDLGVTYFLLYFADFPSLDGLRLFKTVNICSPG